MVKFCPACGAKIGEGAIFCGQCGASVGESHAVSAQPRRLTRAIPGWILVGAGLTAMAMLALLVWLLRPSDLDENQASELIALNGSEPITAPLVTRESVFPVNISVDRETGAFLPFHQQQIDQTRARLEPLRRAGFITFEEENVSASLFSSRLGNVVFHIKTTSKLDPYIVGGSPNGRTIDVKIGDIVTDQITSIVPMGDDLRIVRYTRKVEFNELANLLQTAETPSTPPEAELNIVRMNGDWVIKDQDEAGH